MSKSPAQAETRGVSATREDPRWTPEFSTSKSPRSTSIGAARPPAEWEDGPSMATRVTSTRFVGRAAELAELCAALAASAAGNPSLALVAGESGVGKSRLAGELTRAARESGARVLSGDCVELGEGELPYAPLVGALRRVAREDDPVFDELPAAQRADLATILPGPRRRRSRRGRRGRAGARLRGAARAVRHDGRRAAAACSWSRTCTGPTAPPARSSASSPARSAPSASWWSAPTAPTSCTAAIRCARCWPSSRAIRSLA